METWKYIITRNFIILCLYPFSKISDLPPWLRARYSTEDITFWKPPVEFFDLSLYSKKVQRKQAFTPGNSAKLCDTPWKFQGPKPGPGHGNHTIFSCTPLEILLFFNWPLEFPNVLSSIPMSSTPVPVWFFGEFRPKTYSFTENCECQLKSGRGLIQKTTEKNAKKLSKSWHFSHLKTVYKILRLGDFPGFNNTFTANISRIWEKRGGSSLVREPVSQYDCSVRTFLKLMIKIEHTKLILIPCLDIWSMLLSGQVPRRTNSDHLFWNLKYLVLVQVLF